MKKLSVLLALAVISITAMSQDQALTNKNGFPILPESGDWCVSIDATPFLNYFGGFFSDAGATAPYWGFTAQNPGSITGKYVVSDKMAYRATVLLGVYRTTSKSSNWTDPDKIDKEIESALSIGLLAGMERYTNVNSRLRGVYGFQAGVEKQPYYGSNPLSGGSLKGSYTLLGSYSYLNGDDDAYDEKVSGGNTWEVSAGVFVGAEYFFAPKISLSGEFCYGLSIFTQAKQTVTPSEVSGMDEYEIPGSASGFSLSPCASGSLVMSFYF